jgi:hypothetical protein
VKELKSIPDQLPNPAAYVRKLPTSRLRLTHPSFLSPLKVFLSGVFSFSMTISTLVVVALFSLATVVSVPASQATMQMKSVIYNPFFVETFDETLIVDVGLRPILSQKISLNERLGSTGIEPPWDFYIVGRVCFLCLTFNK